MEPAPKPGLVGVAGDVRPHALYARVQQPGCGGLNLTPSTINPICKPYTLHLTRLLRERIKSPRSPLVGTFLGTPFGSNGCQELQKVYRGRHQPVGCEETICARATMLTPEP